MVKIALQIQAQLENIEELHTNHPDYAFLLKVKCLNCGEVSEKFHDVLESQTIPTKTGRGHNHFQAKCKLCGRENSLNIIEGSNGKFTNNDEGSFKSLVVFDCRGIEPVEFSPSKGWIAKAAESGTVFNDIDLSSGDWADYDEKLSDSVGIYELQSKFVTVK